MKQKIFVIGVLALTMSLLLSGGPPVAAQGGETSPLIVLNEGNFWRWNDSTQSVNRVTTHGYNEQPVLSPDGTRFAYNSWAQFYTDALQAGTGAWPGDGPSNIWVWDIATEDATRIADQPPGAVLNPSQATAQAAFFIRSAPAWSPDSTKLAYREVAVFANEWQSRLMMYDFATGQTQVVTSDIPLGFQDGGLYMPPVKWGSAGIATVISTYREGLDPAVGAVTEVLVYQPGNATPVVDVFLPQGVFIADFIWANDGARDVMGLLRYDTGQWDVLDPVSQSITPMNGLPELVNPYVPNSLRVQLNTSRQDDGNLLFTWAAITADGLGATQLFQHINWEFRPVGSNIAIAPSGQQISYLHDAAYVWSNAGRVTVSNAASLTQEPVYRLGNAWGQMTWQISSNGSPPGPGPGTPTSAEQVQCNTSLPTRLTIGGQGRVTPNTSPNNLRLQPNTGSGQIGQLPPGDPFIVLGGPVCANGMAWWQVAYGPTIGWTVEGQGSTYWVEPLP